MVVLYRLSYRGKQKTTIFYEKAALIVKCFSKQIFAPWQIRAASGSGNSAAGGLLSRKSSCPIINAMNAQELLAVNLERARKRMGMSRSRLAKMARLSTGYIGEIELGKKFPSAEKLESISGALGLWPYQLFYEAGDWEVYDKYDEIACLRARLKEKLKAILEESVRRHLGDHPAQGEAPAPLVLIGDDGNGVRQV